MKKGLARHASEVKNTRTATSAERSESWGLRFELKIKVDA